MVRGEIDETKKRVIYGIRTSTKIFDTMSMQNRKNNVGLSMDNEEKASKTKSLTCKDKLIISENNKWKATFDVFMLLWVGYSCFTSVYYVTFSSPTNIFQVSIDNAVEVFFGLDLIVNFFQEYKDLETYA